jgi:hypothetical protein
MAELLPTSENNFNFRSRVYKLSEIAYDGTNVTFKVDQSAESVSTVLPFSGAPIASLGSSDSNFEKTVTLAAGGTASIVIVIAAHGGGTIASTKN